MQCYRVYTPLWLWYWLWVHNVLQRLAWGKKIQPTQQGGRKMKGDVWASRSLEGYSQDAGSEIWEPRRRRLVRRPVEACRAKLRSYGTCRGGHVRDVGLHAQKRGWAHGVTWIAKRRRWSRYGESPWRRNVRDCGREDDGIGLPITALRAVSVPGEFCVIKNTLRAKFKIVSSYPSADSRNPRLQTLGDGERSWNS